MLLISSYYTQLTGNAVAVGTGLVKAKEAGAILSWGNFATITVNFIIIAWVLFMVVKGMNKLKKADAAAPAVVEPTASEKLLAEIRDALKK
jgi:large conductance mechanosensitive channel